jgi:hypothetical protein
MRLAGLAFVVILLARGAAAGETRCWLENGALVAPAAFGDSAGDFIIDLAAPESLLHLTAAQMAGLPEDSARAPLRIAGEAISRARLKVADLDARTGAFVTNIEGVIGVDLLKAYVIEFQPSPCRLGLYRPGSRGPRGARRLRVRMVDGVPAVLAGVSDGAVSRRGWFAIDTASEGVRLADARLTRAPPKGEDPGSRITPPARLRALSLAGDLFEQTPAGLISPTTPGLDGALGLAVWRRYRFRLDIARGWLDLAPSP